MKSTLAFILLVAFGGCATTHDTAPKQKSAAERQKEEESYRQARVQQLPAGVTQQPPISSNFGPGVYQGGFRQP